MRVELARVHWLRHAQPALLSRLLLSACLCQRFRESRAADLEELVPKETGREAMLEKRRARGSYARVDDSHAGMEEVGEEALMGARGGDEYNALCETPQQHGGVDVQLDLRAGCLLTRCCHSFVLLDSPLSLFSLAKRQAATARADAEAASKRSEYEAKERERMKKMLESIGMADKYPIK